jgi:hypothetical protein
VVGEIVKVAPVQVPVPPTLIVWEAVREGLPLSVAVIVDWPEAVGVMSVSVTGPNAPVAVVVAVPVE